MPSSKADDVFVFEFVSVALPPLIGPRGGIYYLASTPTLALGTLGRKHFECRHLHSPPKPLFPGHPRLDWHPAPNEQRSTCWGAARSARAAVYRAIRKTARQLNVETVVKRGGRISRLTNMDGSVKTGASLNMLQFRDIHYIMSQIITAIRQYDEWYLAWSETLAIPRNTAEPIVVAWQAYDARTTEQLRQLLRAAERGTQARLELKWYQAPPAMRYFIWRSTLGVSHSSRAATLAMHIVQGDMISASVPSREYLRLVLPESIKLSANQRGRRVQATDLLLAQLREIFLLMVGDGKDRLRVGRYDFATGPGADFVRELEVIFRVRLFDQDSLHTIKRARKLADAIAARRLRPERLKWPQFVDYPDPQG